MGGEEVVGDPVEDLPLKFSELETCRRPGFDSRDLHFVLRKNWKFKLPGMLRRPVCLVVNTKSER